MVERLIIGVFSSSILPYVILTDQGSHFVSKLMHELSQLRGIERLKSTDYHPQTNGTIERSHAILRSHAHKNSPTEFGLGFPGFICTIYF